MKLPSNLIIEADGGSRGNPGIAGSGACVIDADTGEVILEISKFIGVATNNVAEYLALVAGLEGAYSLNADARILVRMDSKLVIEQMAGRWKIKHPDMQQLGARVQKIVAGKQVRWQWIPREENSRADALANKAMDEQGDAFISAKEAGPRASVVEFNQTLPSSVRAPRGVTELLTTVVLVRHGRTHLTESKRISGRGGENPGLSDLGREDAHKVAKALAEIGNTGPWSHLSPISSIVASPIQRTMDTAHIISNELGLGVQVNENIAEISFGDWDGHTNEEVMSKWAADFENWQGSWTVSPPNGESLEVFDARVQTGRRQILSEHTGKTVVVVSHVMPIRGFIRAGMDAGVAGYWRPQISPCSITIIRFWGDQAAEVLTVNATSHL
jgi:ribonuclease H / adenosylcobalamin/alpha-ribazole phosphatase